MVEQQGAVGPEEGMRGDEMDKDGGGDWEKKKSITVVTIEIESLSPNLSSRPFLV